MPSASTVTPSESSPAAASNWAMNWPPPRDAGEAAGDAVSCAPTVAHAGARSKSESTTSAMSAPLGEAGRSIVPREEGNGARYMIRLAFVLRCGRVQHRIFPDPMARSGDCQFPLDAADFAVTPL